MVDPHHLAPAEADQGDEGGEITVVRPYIKDTDFGLGGSEGGINDGFKGNALLEEVMVALDRGDGGELVVRDRKSVV